MPQQFFPEVIPFKIAQKVTNVLGYFCKQVCFQNFQKLANLVTLPVQPLLHIFVSLSFYSFISNTILAVKVPFIYSVSLLGIILLYRVKGFLKIGPFPASFFLHFCLFKTVCNTVDSNKRTGFELWISGVGSNRSTNWATTTAHCR